MLHVDAGRGPTGGLCPWDSEGALAQDLGPKVLSSRVEWEQCEGGPNTQFFFEKK